MTGEYATAGQQSDALPSAPPPAPSRGDVDQTEQWDQFLELGASDTATSVSRWGEGLASLASAAGAALLIVNAPEASTLQGWWRVAVVGGMAVAALAGISGLWCSLTATAGIPKTITKEKFKSRYGTVQRFQEVRLTSAVARSQWARGTIIASITATLLTAGLLWLAPTTSPVVLVQVQDAEYCGTIRSGDHGELHLVVTGERDARVIPLRAIENLSVADSC